jgi:signal transduction histidine kinase
VTAAAAQEFVSGALWDESGQWWYGDKQLYQVFLQPIYFGPAKEDRVLGFLVLGYEVDDRLTGEVSRVAASQVAFRYGHAIVRSTLSPVQEAELLRQSAAPSTAGDPATQDIRLGNERFLTASVELASGAATPVQLFVLKSLDQATGFLDPLNQQLVGLGAEAVLLGGMLVFFISRTFARPLEELVAGVRALEKGDFDYPLDAPGSDEAAELTRAFARMRHNLQKTQRELLEIERLATIGRMANSISHDLRHSLAVVVANSEFLCQGNLTTGQREELYQEVCLGVNQMTDLIDSLLEFSRTRESLRPAHGNVQAALEHARQAVQAHPEYSRVNIEISCEGRADAWFDAKKLERAFQNLLLNACEAVPREAGRIQVTLKETGQGLEARVKDNGPGISAAVRDKLFEPFVSFGKENGTGLGLTVVQKILQDHGGDVVVESSSSQGTVFKVTLPVPSYAETVSGSGK